MQARCLLQSMPTVLFMLLRLLLSFLSVQAANYLNIKGLLDLTCQTVANMIKGESVEMMTTVQQVYCRAAASVQGLFRVCWQHVYCRNVCMAQQGGDPVQDFLQG